MRSAKIILCVIGILGVCAPLDVDAQRGPAQTSAKNQQTSEKTFAQVPPKPKRIVIAASAVLDGKGRVLRNTRIVIEGSKIVAIDSKAGPVDYDLRGLTVLPGWIDAHAHVTWSFGKDGKNVGPGETTPEAAYRSAANAY